MWILDPTVVAILLVQCGKLFKLPTAFPFWEASGIMHWLWPSQFKCNRSAVWAYHPGVDLGSGEVKTSSLFFLLYTTQRYWKNFSFNFGVNKRLFITLKSTKLWDLRRRPNKLAQLLFTSYHIMEVSNSPSFLFFFIGPQSFSCLFLITTVFVFLCRACSL